MAFTKNCPTCGKEQIFTTKANLFAAKRDDTRCKKCSARIFRRGDWRDSAFNKEMTFIKNCPSCGKAQRYSNKGNLEMAQKKNIACRACAMRVAYGRSTEDYSVNMINGCWEWNGCLSRGYGSLSIDGHKPQLAHRVYYERFKSPIPPGLQLDHLCRNRKCVNPDHLEAVSPATNVRRGITTKLTESQVKEIRKRLGTVEDKILSEEYGVNAATISCIKHNKSWKNI